MTGDSVTLQVREVLATAKHLDAQRVVTLLRFDQRDRWLRHQHIPAETYIRELAAAGNTQNALDLVVNEFLIREEMGQNPSFDEYGQRFPQFRAQLEEQVKLFRQLGSLVKPASGQASTDTPQPVATVPAEHIHIPGYQVFRRIGNGATGAVYKAKQLSLNRMVAIKTIDAARFQPVTVQRFQRDTQAATKLGHANVARIFDRGVTGSQHFVAMEYVEGFSLGRLVESWGKLPIPLACECVLQVCHALQHLHENGLVHRDVKPGHLVLTTDVGTRSWADESVPPFEFWSTRQFVVKLIDMGLAHAIALEAPQSGEQVGSPEYIAPEQLANAQQVDIRADLYSLGCTFYYLLSGKVPFEGRNVTEILDKHRWAPPRLVKLTRPDVPMELAEIIRKLMGKRPEERFQTPAEAEAALKGLMAKERALFEPAEQLRSKTEPGPALAAQPAGMAGTAAAPAAPTAGGTKSLPLPGRVRLPDPAPPAAPGSAPQAPAAPTAPQAPAAASPPPTSPARPTIPSIELTPTPGRANIEMTPTPRSALSKFEQLRNRQKLESPSWAGTTPRPPVEAPRPEPTLKPEGVKPPDSLEPPPPKRKGGLSDSDLLAKRRRMLDSGEMPAAIPGAPVGPAPEPVLKALATSTGDQAEEKKEKPKDKPKKAKKPQELQAILADQIEKNEYMGARLTVTQLLEVSPNDEVALAAQEFLKEQSGECGRFTKHTDWVTALAIAPNNKFFVSGGRDKTVRIWDMETGAPKHVFTIDSTVNGVSISADSKHVVCGDSQGFMRLWEAESGKEVRRFRGFDGEVLAVAMSHGGRFVLSGTKRAMNVLWEIETGRTLRQLRGHRAEVIAVAVALGNRLILSSSKDCTVRLWGGDKFREQRRIDLKTVYANSIAFAGETFAVLGTSDNFVRIWNLNEGKEARCMAGHTGPVNSVAIAGNNGRILSGASDNTVRFWRVRSGKQISSFTGHTDEVLAVAMTNDAKFGLSGSKDQSIRLWKLPERIEEEE